MLQAERLSPELRFDVTKLCFQAPLLIQQHFDPALDLLFRSDHVLLRSTYPTVIALGTSIT